MITFVDMRGLGSTVDDVSDSWEELVTEVMSFSYVSLVLHYASLTFFSSMLRTDTTGRSASEDRSSFNPGPVNSCLTSFPLPINPELALELGDNSGFRADGILGMRRSDAFRDTGWLVLSSGTEISSKEPCDLFFSFRSFPCEGAVLTREIKSALKRLLFFCSVVSSLVGADSCSFLGGAGAE